MAPGLYDASVGNVSEREMSVRPSTMLSLASAVLFAVGSAVISVIAFFAHKDAETGVKWHYWLAPILMLGLVACLLQLVGMYWLQVGRKETRGRRRSG